MAKYVIEGGAPLKGEINILGAKNVGFKLMIAALLSDKISTISNIANNSNISWVSEAISDLGCSLQIEDKHTRTLSGLGLSQKPLKRENTISRAPTMFLPILLHRNGTAKVPVPSGDKIGQRPIERHLEGLKSMGTKIEHVEGFINAEISGKFKGTDYKFEKNTHTGTETLILAACLAEGKTKLENAAVEPEVDDLILFLNRMGAKISRKSQRTIEIQGVPKLNGTTHEVMPDRSEAVTFGCIALATKGDVIVNSARKKDLLSFIEKVEAAGGGVEVGKSSIRFFHRKNLRATDITTKPHPGFMTDWQPLWTTLMTQAVGKSTIHETVFESRFSFVQNLQKMGAKIETFEPKMEEAEKIYNFNWKDRLVQLPHALKVFGPTDLQSAEIAVTDIRAGATLVLAALAAEGESVLDEVEHIERGYEDLEGRLEGLGAKIRRIL